MSCTSCLCNNAGQLIDLPLGAAKRAQLESIVSMGTQLGRALCPETYPLLGQLACTLVLAVAQQFDHAALIGGKTTGIMSAQCHCQSSIGQVIAVAQSPLVLRRTVLESRVGISSPTEQIRTDWTDKQQATKPDEGKPPTQQLRAQSRAQTWSACSGGPWSAKSAAWMCAASSCGPCSARAPARCVRPPRWPFSSW